MQQHDGYPTILLPIAHRRVVLAGLCGSTARAFIESPLELAKVRPSTNF